MTSLTTKYPTTSPPLFLLLFWRSLTQQNQLCLSSFSLRNSRFPDSTLCSLWVKSLVVKRQFSVPSRFPSFPSFLSEANSSQTWRKKLSASWSNDHLTHGLRSLFLLIETWGLAKLLWEFQSFDWVLNQASANQKRWPLWQGFRHCWVWIVLVWWSGRWIHHIHPTILPKQQAQSQK